MARLQSLHTAFKNITKRQFQNLYSSLGKINVQRANVRYVKPLAIMPRLYTTFLPYYKVWLRDGRSEDRIPVGARFIAHVQTGPWAHPASSTMGAGSFPGVKWPGRGADHPPPSSSEVTND
jgi:hypothetical protein